MEVALIVPFALLRGPGYLQPVQFLHGHYSSYLKGKDEYAVVLALAALAALQAPKSDPSDLAGQGEWRKKQGGSM